MGCALDQDGGHEGRSGESGYVLKAKLVGLTGEKRGEVTYRAGEH